MLGNNLCHYLQDEFNIFAFHRQKVLVPCYDNFSVDLTNSNEITNYIKKIKPSYIIHTAGLVNIEKSDLNPDLCYIKNVKTTEHLANICSEKIKLIYISTDQIYGKNKFKTEDKKLYPLNQYGKSKYLAENIVLKTCKNGLIIRTNPFGWNIKSDRISSAEWIYQSLVNKKITLYNDYIFSPIYSGELALILIKLLKYNKSGIYNIASKNICSKYDFGLHLAEIIKSNTSLIIEGTIKENSFLSNRNFDLSLNTKNF